MFTRLQTYLDSVRSRDPAPRSRWEILLYPGVWALGFHRLAHWLFYAKLYFLARMVNHISRLLTATMVAPAGTSSITTALAPIRARSPTVIGPITCAPDPIMTLSPIVGWRLPPLPLVGLVPPKVTH